MKCETCRWWDKIINNGRCKEGPLWYETLPTHWCSHWAIKHDPDPTIEKMIVRLQRMLAATPEKKLMDETMSTVGNTVATTQIDVKSLSERVRVLVEDIHEILDRLEKLEL